MIPYVFTIDDDLNYKGKYDEEEDQIIINCAGIESITDLEDTVHHEDIHALITWATTPNEPTAEQDHWIIRRLGFE